VKRTKLNIQHQQLSHTLAPSFDVLREIAIQQASISLSTDTLHVKGHQDRVKPSDQLTLPEQLNIKADRIAAEASVFFLKRKNLFQQYCLPNGGPYLCVDGKAIWSGETNLLRWRRSEFILQQYYIDTFKISPETLHSINWAGLRIARQTLSPGLLQFSCKFGIDWLPTGHHMQRRGSIVTECILCGEEETNNHLLLCSHRIDTMMKVLGQFHAYLIEIQTDPTIIAILVNQIAKTLVLPYNNIPINGKTPIIYQKAIDVQNRIGWLRFTRGYIANHWAIIQEQYFTSHNSSKLGDTWSSKISLWWIKQCHCIWMERNNSVHTKQIGTISRLEEETFAQVRQLYNQIDLLPAADREILDMPLEARLQQPVQTLQHWINITTPTVHQCIQTFTSQLTQAHNQITTFFPWRDVRNRSDTQVSAAASEVASTEVTAIHTNRQESLSSCKK
jgi:hypothetical protein